MQADRRQGLKKLRDLLDSIGPGMLTTVAADGQLTSRPMSPLDLDADGALWFFIRDPAPARHREPGMQVNLAFAQPDEAAYVSISGKAYWLKDARRVDALWSSTATLWFAQGRDDPAVSLLRVDITSACCWDAHAGQMRSLLGDD